MAWYDFILIRFGLWWLFSVIWNKVDKSHNNEIENYKKRIEELIEERDRYKQEAEAWERDCRYFQEENCNLNNSGEQTDERLKNLCKKKKWNHEECEEFQNLWKEKYWKDWVKNKDAVQWFYENWKTHAEKVFKRAWSWKKCVTKFRSAWFEILEHDESIEGFKIPFTIYHNDVAGGCDIVKVVEIFWKFKKQNNIYYLCMWENGWVWLIAKKPPKSFGKLGFHDFHCSIDYVEKDWKESDCSWKRNVYQIYKEEE